MFWSAIACLLAGVAAYASISLTRRGAIAMPCVAGRRCWRRSPGCRPAEEKTSFVKEVSAVRTGGWRRSGAGGGGGKRLRQIGQQVVAFLDADGQADQGIADSEARARF